MQRQSRGGCGGRRVEAGNSRAASQAGQGPTESRVSERKPIRGDPGCAASPPPDPTAYTGAGRRRPSRWRLLTVRQIRLWTAGLCSFSISPTRRAYTGGGTGASRSRSSHRRPLTPRQCLLTVRQIGLWTAGLRSRLDLLEGRLDLCCQRLGFLALGNALQRLGASWHSSRSRFG